MSGYADGLRAWLLQRITAIYLGVYLVYLLVHFWLHPRPDYTQWRDWFAQPLVAIGSAGFFLALLLHGWVGVRDVILDYVHHLGLRLVILVMVAVLLIACGLWTVRILMLAGG